MDITLAQEARPGAAKGVVKCRAFVTQHSQSEDHRDEPNLAASLR